MEYLLSFAILSVFINYLSIYLYVLTPEGDIRRVPAKQVLEGGLTSSAVITPIQA